MKELGNQRKEGKSNRNERILAKNIKKNKVKNKNP